MAAFIETETTVSGIQADGYFIIGTNREKHITRLNKEVANGRASVVRNSADWLEVKVSADVFDPLTGFKKQLSAETRQAMRDRAKARFGK